MSGKVTVKADSLRSVLNELNSPAMTRRVGELVVEEVKDSLEVGLSPVRGVRRFQQYTDPYPGNKKASRPVNLKLTGAMLDALKYFFRGSRLFVGITGSEGVKAQAHNDGQGNMPERHFLPTRAGEEFTVSIMQKVKNLYERMLSGMFPWPSL